MFHEIKKKLGQSVKAKPHEAKFKVSNTRRHSSGNTSQDALAGVSMVARFNAGNGCFLLSIYCITAQFSCLWFNKQIKLIVTVLIIFSVGKYNISLRHMPRQHWSSCFSLLSSLRVCGHDWLVFTRLLVFYYIILINGLQAKHPFYGHY